MIEAIHGECVAEMQRMAKQGCTFHAIVTDPPYHLTSITKRFSKGEPEHTKTAKDIAGRKTPMARHARGFMGKRWDGGDVAFRVETWKAAHDVLRPGGWLLAFGSTRGHHRMICAIEDAGFEIRDCFLDLISTDARVKNFVNTLSPEQIGAFAEILQQMGMQGMLAWIYGSGMPKSLDVAKEINKKAGVKFEEVPASGVGFMRSDGRGGWNVTKNQLVQVGESTEEAKQWDGYGTGLKPAWEPIIIARKPIKRSVAENVMEYGTGALNINACRLGGDTRRVTGNPGYSGGWRFKEGAIAGSELGRYPANVVLDDSLEVAEEFEKFGFTKSIPKNKQKERPKNKVYGKNLAGDGYSNYSDSGLVSRFFYSAKADEKDKVEGSEHPTVKPVSLIYYLLKLVVPKGGSVLDPFAGTGTIATAAHYLNVDVTMIEADQGYFQDIQRRIKGLQSEGLFGLT